MRILLFVIIFLFVGCVKERGITIDGTHTVYCTDRKDCPCLVSDTSETIITEDMIRDCCALINNATYNCKFEGATHIIPW